MIFTSVYTYIYIYISIYKYIDIYGFLQLRHGTSYWQKPDKAIKEVKLNGNKKIGYNIRNTMMVYSNPGSENRININLKVDKKKVSKEKNISNTITKFIVFS